MQKLHHAAQQVVADIAKKRKPGDHYSEAMRHWYAWKTEIRPDIPEEARLAFDIYEDQRQNYILEALILSDCPPETVREALGVPEKVTAWYRELFFDTSVFRTKLDRIAYIQELDGDEKDIKMKAVDLGYEFVLATYAGIIPRTDAQKRLVEKVYMATAYKAMAMNYNTLSSEATRLSVRHAELMLKAYDTLVKLNASRESSKDDFVDIMLRADELASARPRRETQTEGEIV